MDTNNQPLVSVPVITYNSAKYVLETLESVKAQTYQNCFLIPRTGKNALNFGISLLICLQKIRS